MIDLIVHNIMTYNNESKHIQKYHNKHSIFWNVLVNKSFHFKNEKNTILYSYKKKHSVKNYVIFILFDTQCLYWALKLVGACLSKQDKIPSPIERNLPLASKKK